MVKRVKDFGLVFQRHVDKRSKEIMRRDKQWDRVKEECDLWWTKKKEEV